LDNVAIPKFDLKNNIHKRVAKLSLRCHEKTSSGIDVSDIEDEIDQLVADSWGLTSEELRY